jgi:hypothetical protein
MALTLSRLAQILAEAGSQIHGVNPPAGELSFSVPELAMDCPVRARLEQGGTLLRLGVQVATCSPSHLRFTDMLRRLASLNRSYGVIRLGWSESDQAVVADADHWVADTSPTPCQIARLVRSYLTALVACRLSIRDALNGDEKI